MSPYEGFSGKLLKYSQLNMLGADLLRQFRTEGSLNPAYYLVKSGDSVPDENILMAIQEGDMNFVTNEALQSGRKEDVESIQDRESISQDTIPPSSSTTINNNLPESLVTEGSADHVYIETDIVVANTLTSSQLPLHSPESSVMATAVADSVTFAAIDLPNAATKPSNENPSQSAMAIVTQTVS